MNEALLRNSLREWITEDYVLVELREFEDEFDSSGQPIPHPEMYRASQRSRLAGLQRVAPDRTDLHDEHRAALIALSSIAPNERLYFWSARGSTRDHSGVACAGGIISFYSLHSSPNDGNRWRSS